MFTLWSVIYTGYLVDNQVSEQVAAVSFPLAVTSNFCEAKGDFPADKTQLNKNNKTSYYWYYYSFTLWLVIKSLSCKAEELYKISTKKHIKSLNSTSLLKSVKSQDVLATAHVFFSLVCLLFFINISSGSCSLYLMIVNRLSGNWPFHSSTLQTPLHIEH